MPRIIVTTNLSLLPDDTTVLLDEQVGSVHVSTGHASAQLLERLAWAISDAEAAEDTHPDRHARPVRQSPRPPLATRPGARVPVGV